MPVLLDLCDPTLRNDLGGRASHHLGAGRRVPPGAGAKAGEAGAAATPSQRLQFKMRSHQEPSERRIGPGLHAALTLSSGSLGGAQPYPPALPRCWPSNVPAPPWDRSCAAASAWRPSPARQRRPTPPASPVPGCGAARCSPSPRSCWSWRRSSPGATRSCAASARPTRCCVSCPRCARNAHV